jgi:hypothetical protein
MRSVDLPVDREVVPVAQRESGFKQELSTDRPRDF